MSVFSENIKYLREKKKATQQFIAESINISRDRYAKYENGVNSPTMEILIDISRYHHVSIDILLSVDLRKIPLEKLLELPDNRILLPIAVDRSGENCIEIIPHKAQAGYLTGYADPEFIGNLQHISLPFLGSGKYRAFPIDGDSMPPHKQGSFIVGKFIETPRDIINDRTYILLTANEGIVYKRVHKDGDDSLILSSDNIQYSPYQIKTSDVLEIWQYECNIGRSDTKFIDSIPGDLQGMFLELLKEIRNIRN